MKIGIVGYQGSGKSTLFEWLSGVKPDPKLAHLSQSAMAAVPDERIDPLCKVYSPKKVTMASLELADTPGLSRTHEGNAARLGLIREAGCLLLVVAGFGGAHPLAELAAFDEDLLLADLEIVSGRVERLRESVKKFRPNRDQEVAELAALEPLLATLETGKSLHGMTLSEDADKATRSFRLLTTKPKMVILNVADDADPAAFPKSADATGDAAGGSKSAVPIVAVPVGLELELTRMAPDDRADFEKELGGQRMSRDLLLREIMNASGQMLYFTAGEKEVRTWMLNQGGTALEAAGNVHTDLARGFIRAEVMQCADLIRLGSEREIKAHSLMRQEGKDYVIRDGDILHIRSGV